MGYIKIHASCRCLTLSTCLARLTGDTMIQIDWSLVQLQYEVFGESFDEIAKAYDTTPRMIEYAAEKRGWKRLPVAEAVQNWTDLDKLEDVSDELIDEVQKRMKIMRTIKESALAPRYMAVETAILGKALELLQNLDSTDPHATIKLKAVAEVLKSLKDQNGMTVQSAQNEQNAAPSFKINILNHVSKEPESKIRVEHTKIDGGHTVAPRVAPSPTPEDA